MRYIFDIETDGLLDELTCIHAVVLLNIDKGEMFSCPPDKHAFVMTIEDGLKFRSSATGSPLHSMGIGRRQTGNSLISCSTMGGIAWKVGGGRGLSFTRLSRRAVLCIFCVFVLGESLNW